jgi:hypothetical protein
MNLLGWHEVCEGCSHIFITPSGSTNHKNACKKLLKRFAKNMKNIRAQKTSQIGRINTTQIYWTFNTTCQIAFECPPLPGTPQQIGFFPEIVSVIPNFYVCSSGK